MSGNIPRKLLAAVLAITFSLTCAVASADIVIARHQSSSVMILR